MTTMRVVLEVQVDDLAWGKEYGVPASLDPGARDHVTALLGEAVDAKAAQMGTFTVRHISTQVYTPRTMW